MNKVKDKEKEEVKTEEVPVLSIEEQLAEKRKKDMLDFSRDYEALIQKYGYRIAAEVRLTEQGAVTEYRPIPIR